jgi:hypothetical protein
MKTKKQFSNRSNSICQFRKTKHFTERQHERNISDGTLKECLKCIQHERTKITYVVSRKKLKRIGLTIQSELFIVVDNNVLVTVYPGDFQEFLLTTKKKSCLIIIINEFD